MPLTDSRGTGRTTRQIFEYALEALRWPGVPVITKDHYDSPSANLHMFRTVMQVLHDNGVEVSANAKTYSITVIPLRGEHV